jgi:lysophosphatidic acid acyltransferase/lysophosphatidylinositol acyltransferase
MKGPLKFLPVIGWMWWFAEYVFLKRNWDSDVPVLQKSLKRLKDFPIPFFVSICFGNSGTHFVMSEHCKSY